MKTQPTLIAKEKIARKDGVSFWQKLAYGLGGPLEGTAIWIPKGNLMPVFNIGLGMNPAVISLILLIWRAWDGFADPIMGNISDNARTRWGRRKPFIVVGAILTGITLPVIWWMPRGLADWQMTLWLLISGLIFYTCYTVWAMPYYSLQLEMSPDYNERTNITAYRAMAQKVMALASGWILALASLPIFSRSESGSPDLVNGMRYISLFLAVVTIGLGVLPGIFVRERYYQAAVKKQGHEKLLLGMKQTLSNRPFLWILAIVVTYSFGFSLVSSLGFYVNAYYICSGDIALAAKIQGVKSTLLFAPNLLAVPLCTWLANRYDKRFILYLTALSGLVGSLSIYIFYTPANPWLQIIPSLLIGPVNIGLWLVVPSMQADVADYDELQTGLRREGSFSSIFSWVYKMAITVTSGLSGLMLVWTGFDAAHGGKQPGHVMENLKLMYIWIPVFCLVICIFAISRYNLTRDRMQEIREALEEKRGVI
jgi:glycoside/pentoside/hexuronide:cation symporter, GPH family